jgi:deoxyribodipyrimidine photo-lyase
MTDEEQQQYGVRMGTDYPHPIPASRFGRPHGGGAVGGDPAGPSKTKQTGQQRANKKKDKKLHT